MKVYVLEIVYGVCDCGCKCKCDGLVPLRDRCQTLR